MVINSDIMLKGSSWNRTIEALSCIFKSKPHYMIYLLALSIGIMYDQRAKELIADPNDDTKSIPRAVIRNQDQDRFGIMYEAAILTTATENLTEEERLSKAYDEKTEDREKWAFLMEFANFGVTKLESLIGETPLESMENIKNFLNNSVEGKNLDIDGLPDDLLLG